MKKFSLPIVLNILKFYILASGLEDAQQRPNLGMYAAGNAGPGLSDYYYEDSQLRGRLPIQQDPRSFENNEGAAFGQV